MLNKNERMEKLNNAGIDTSKYFNVSLPNGLKPGATIALVINENGEPMIVNANKNDVIAEQIISDGYVRNTKLHRRFVMAQMFHMLNYSNRFGESGYHACLNNMYGYDYTFKMMLEEVRVLSKLETRDRESFEERNHFFTKGVVIAVMEDYLKKLEEYVDKLPNRNCKGVPYKRVKGVNIFNADLEKKIYSPVRSKIYDMYRAKNYNEIYKMLGKFMNNMIKLPYQTAKSKAWIDAYKGEGAYYTCKNLIMFHNCRLFENYKQYTTEDSMIILKKKLDLYRGEGWRMFACMKKLINDNNFDFYTKMSEIYNN